MVSLSYMIPVANFCYILLGTAWRVRPSCRTNSSPVFTKACRTESRDKLLTDARNIHCLLAFNGNAFAVRFSRSAIFFIGEFLATIWPFNEILRSFVSYVCTVMVLTRKLMVGHWTKYHRLVCVFLIWPSMNDAKNSICQICLIFIVITWS